jgi:hypothetical protein
MRIEQSGGAVLSVSSQAILLILSALAACGSDAGSNKQSLTAGQGGGTATLSLPAHTAGKSCSQDAECQNGSCAKTLGSGNPLLGAAPADAPGGYCTSGCLTSAECGEGGACIGAGQATGFPGAAGSGSTTRGLCYASCTTSADCRDKYRCISAFGTPIVTAIGVNGSCQPAPPTDKLGDSVVGTMCSGDSDCDGGSCMSSDVFSAAGYPGGYCSGRCLADSDCGSAGVCSGAIGGGAGTCYRKCEADADCARAGYRCRASALAGLMGTQSASKQCTPGADPLPDGAVGSACHSDAECGGAAMSCKDQLAGQFGGAATTLPGGYCSESCVDASDCGAGGVCAGSFAGVVAGNCFKGCANASECRTGYSCGAAPAPTIPGGGMIPGGAMLPRQTPTQSVCSPMTATPTMPAAEQDAGVP